MRTTIRINDELLKKAKIRAAETNRSLTEVKGTTAGLCHEKIAMFQASFCLLFGRKPPPGRLGHSPTSLQIDVRRAEHDGAV